MLCYAIVCFVYLVWYSFFSLSEDLLRRIKESAEELEIIFYWNQRLQIQCRPSLWGSCEFNTRTPADVKKKRKSGCRSLNIRLFFI
ncbi:hypothetical protein BDF14DRAFT_1849635 [Spinellus fusiger]|nr:hypothetical protein BDF14DRAFT_1849635 [Spinellus fusiger]